MCPPLPPIQLRMTSNPWSSCFYLPSTEITSARPEWFIRCCGLNLGSCTSPTGLHPQALVSAWASQSRGLGSLRSGPDLSRLCGPGCLLSSPSLSLPSGKKNPLRRLFYIKRSCSQPTIQLKTTPPTSSQTCFQCGDCPEQGVMSALLWPVEAFLSGWPVTCPFP